MTRFLDLDRLAAAPLAREPFPFVVVEGFLKAGAAEEAARDFPAIPEGGSWPLPSTRPGPAFRALADELTTAETRVAFAVKFGVDLEGRPTTITLRGQSRSKDGRIHTDSKTKLMTVLIYMNAGWTGGVGEGSLRMLRGPDDIDDFVAEVPPTLGTLVAFQCTANAWHGHRPYVGERRSLQLNWVTDEGVARRELRRHAVSALMKRLNPFA